MTDQTTTAPSVGAAAPQHRIDVWADIVCPWCYVGQNALEQALAAEGLTETVQVRLHAFQLDPGAPVAQQADGRDLPTNADYLSRAHGSTPEQIEQGEQQLVEIAAGLGKPYATVRPTGSTRLFHRFVQTVQAHLGPAAALSFFRTLQDGYFAVELSPFDLDVLTSSAEGVGLSPAVARALVTEPESDLARLSERTVDDDISAAQQMGISGVPFVVLREKYASAGARDVATYRGLLRNYLLGDPED